MEFIQDAEWWVNWIQKESAVFVRPQATLVGRRILASLVFKITVFIWVQKLEPRELKDMGIKRAKVLADREARRISRGRRLLVKDGPFVGTCLDVSIVKKYQIQLMQTTGM